jgi:hypothetical protein
MCLTDLIEVQTSTLMWQLYLFKSYLLYGTTWKTHAVSLNSIWSAAPSPVHWITISVYRSLFYAHFSKILGTCTIFHTWTVRIAITTWSMYHMYHMLHDYIMKSLVCRGWWYLCRYVLINLGLSVDFIRQYDQDMCVWKTTLLEFYWIYVATTSRILFQIIRPPSAIWAYG